MHKRSAYSLEFLAAIASIALGLTVSAALAAKSAWYWPNFIFYWAPQLCILGLFCMYKPPRPAFFAGLAFALATYLALFSSWLFFRQDPDSLAWIGYLFSLPGAIVGSLIAINLLERCEEDRPIAVGAVASIVVLAGIGANQAIVCSTVMYCLRK